MLRKEDYLVIKALKKRGVYQKDIAAELGVHPKTVSRALKRDEAPDKPRRQRASKLEPYKETVDHVLATAILDRLLHHATTLNIEGESCRLKEKRRAGLLGRTRPVTEEEKEGVLSD